MEEGFGDGHAYGKGAEIERVEGVGVGKGEDAGVDLLNGLSERCMASTIELFEKG